MAIKKSRKRGATGQAVADTKVVLANVAFEEQADRIALVAFSNEILGTNVASANHVAVVSRAVDRDRLRIIDTSNRFTVAEYAAEKDSKALDSANSTDTSNFSIPFNDAKEFSCIAWGATVVSKFVLESNTSKKSKTGKKPAPQNKLDLTGVDGTVRFVAIGLRNADIILFSPLTNKIIGKLSGTHTAPVVDIKTVYAKGSYRLWSCDADGLVVEWDVLNCLPLSETKTNSKGTKRILISSDATKLVVASHFIQMWDLLSNSKIQAYSGHANSVKFLRWGHGEKMVYSSSEASNTINCWDTSSVSPKPQVLFTLNAQNDIVALQSSIHDGAVLAKTETNSISVWFNVTFPDLKTSDKTISVRSPNRIIVISDKSGSPIDILLAQFNKTAKKNLASLLVAWGSILKPVFETIELEANALETMKEISYTRDRSASNLLLNESKNKALFEQKNKLAFNMYSEQNTSIVEPADQSLSSIGIVNASSYGLSMEEKLRDLQVGSKDALKTSVQLVGSSKSSKDSMLHNPNSAVSLVRALAQAINTNDLDMLDSVLKHFNKPDLVYETVAQLPSQLVVPFILQLSVKLRNNASNITKCRELLPWLKNSFGCHTSYLCSLPHLSKIFDDLYNSILQRMQLQKNIYTLKGKCDLLALQMKQQGNNASLIQSHVPATKTKVYIESINRTISDDQNMGFKKGSKNNAGIDSESDSSDFDSSGSEGEDNLLEGQSFSDSDIDMYEGRLGHGSDSDIDNNGQDGEVGDGDDDEDQELDSGDDDDDDDSEAEAQNGILGNDSDSELDTGSSSNESE